jgi:RNA polymerase sigma-70 factor (ECF subfamily)
MRVSDVASAGFGWTAPASVAQVSWGRAGGGGVTCPPSSPLATRPVSSSPAALEAEPELLARAGRGDPDALEVLYRRHAPRALGVALRIVRVRSDAEEVLQETFLEVWRRAREFTVTRGTVEAWLLTIARTRAIDRLRSRGAQGRLVAARSAEPEAEGPKRPDTARVEAEDGARVRSALASLSAEQRAALELAYWEGLSQTEIAVRTGQPLGTVKTRVRQGLLKLAKLLGE